MQSIGVVVPFDPLIITPPIAAALRADRYESEEAAQIPHILRAGDNVLEIGAGIGFISTLVARQPNVGNIFAVEANPALMAHMARLHAANGVKNVQRINAVLSNMPGDYATFYQRRDFWMGSLAPGPEPYVTQVQVPALSLDGFLRDHAISLIICDIEGAESWLFDGADLSGVDRLYVELHDHISGLSGIAALFAQLGGQGFAYDPRYSDGPIVLFQRVQSPEILRSFSGKTDAD